MIRKTALPSSPWLGIAGVAVALATGACRPAVAPGAAQQSGSLGYDAESGILVAAELDNGKAVFVDAGSRKTLGSVRTGERPERVVVRGDDVYVSNRGSRTVTHLKASTRQIVRQIATGAEPVGLKLSADGTTLVVANAMSRNVQAFSTVDGSRKWQAELGEEVHAVAVLPDGRVYAPGFKTGRVQVLDLETGAAMKAFSLQQPTDLTPGVDFDRTPAGTHDVVVAADGRVYLPHQQVTRLELAPVTFGYYASGPAPAIAPGVSTVDPGTDTVEEEPQPQIFSTNDPGDFPFPPPVIRPSGPLAGPVAAVANSTGEWLYVVNQFSRNLSIVSTTRRSFNDVTGNRFGEGSQGIAQIVDLTGHGANGIVLDEKTQRLYVYNSFDHTIDVIAADFGTIRVTDTIALAAEAPQVLSPEQQIGRKLFHDAREERLTNGAAGGVACASCHPGGREDGHTWKFAEGLRNTPSIAGKHLTSTQPFHWDGQLETMSMFRHVVTNRMGGTGTLAETDFDKIGAWLDVEPMPDNPNRPVTGELTALQEKGKALFEGRASCATCHASGLLTDNQFHDVGTGLTKIRLEFDTPGAFLGPELREQAVPNTPSLIGIFASEPYLHDGRSTTLRERVLDNAGDRHGVTSDLSTEEVDALVAYLETL